MKHKFEKRLESISQEVWMKLASLDDLKGQWVGGVNLHPQVKGRLKKSTLITSTGASTRIEGSRLSDEQIGKMLKGISIKTFSTRDEQEVRGYYELLSSVFDSWGNLKFSEGLIKHFHQELLKYVSKDDLHRGDYKKTENIVEMIDEAGQSAGVLFETTKAYLTPKEMLKLVEWTTDGLKKKNIHPIITIGHFIVEFLKIHPFTDGNGRLSRIITNLLMLQAGYLYVPYVSHEKIIEDNKPDYYLSLRKTQKTLRSKNPNLSEWLNFFLDVLIKQAQTAVDLLNNEQVEEILSPTQLKVWQYFQQTELISPLEISKALNIPRPTINQVLSKLLNLKLIARIGMGSATKYKKI